MGFSPVTGEEKGDSDPWTVLIPGCQPSEQMSSSVVFSKGAQFRRCYKLVLPPNLHFWRIPWTSEWMPQLPPNQRNVNLQRCAVVWYRGAAWIDARNLQSEKVFFWCVRECCRSFRLFTINMPVKGTPTALWSTNHSYTVPYRAQESKNSWLAFSPVPPFPWCLSPPWSSTHHDTSLRS